MRTTGASIKAVVNGVASALAATKWKSHPGIAGSIICTRSHLDDNPYRSTERRKAASVHGSATAHDAVRDLHKSGLDVEIMELTMLTSRGDMKQFDIRTFRAEGAPPDLKVVGE